MGEKLTFTYVDLNYGHDLFLQALKSRGNPCLKSSRLGGVQAAGPRRSALELLPRGRIRYSPFKGLNSFAFV